MTNAPTGRGLLWLTAVFCSAIFLAGCNPSPNTVPANGPSIRFNATNRLQSWPVTTGATNQTGFWGVPTTAAAPMISVMGKNGKANAQVLNIDSSNPTPTFNVVIGIIPGDSTGVTAFSVNVTMLTPCSSDTNPITNTVGSENVGTPNGPALTNPFYTLNISSDQASQQCGNKGSSLGSATYQFNVQATNGAHYSTSDLFIVRAGVSPIPNIGP